MSTGVSPLLAPVNMSAVPTLRRLVITENEHLALKRSGLSIPLYVAARLRQEGFHLDREILYDCDAVPGGTLFLQAAQGCSHECRE